MKNRIATWGYASPVGQVNIAMWGYGWWDTESGPTSAQISSDRTRAKVYDAKAEAVNVMPGTRAKVY